MKVNEKLSSVVFELFLRVIKLNISLVFISHSYFKVLKLRTNVTHYFIMKRPNTRELQQVASNHLPDTELNIF